MKYKDLLSATKGLKVLSCVSQNTWIVSPITSSIVEFILLHICSIPACSVTYKFATTVVSQKIVLNRATFLSFENSLLKVEGAETTQVHFVCTCACVAAILARST